jgi:hypothetical protein
MIIHLPGMAGTKAWKRPRAAMSILQKWNAKQGLGLSGKGLSF